ncbi:MAG: hypothetical protein JJ913_03610 [Rhizobiaceae bacterium]|nr:hypothetical protein [Rhizobiaceae bacterium]
MTTNVATKTFAGFAAAAVMAATLLTSTAASAYERWVYINNDGWTPIYSVEISHVDDRYWGPDLLGPHIIEVGDYMMVEPVNPEGYCLFDVRITFDTGEVTYMEAVDLCRETDIVADEFGAYAFG